MRAAELEQLTAGGDQRLRRDAVPEVRGATDDVALDQRDVGTERGRDVAHVLPAGPPPRMTTLGIDRKFYERRPRAQANVTWLS